MGQPGRLPERADSCAKDLSSLGNNHLYSGPVGPAAVVSHPWLPAVRFTLFPPARRPSAVPQPRRLPWAHCADMTTWSVAGAVHDLVLRVLGLVQRQSQLFHRFHLLVVVVMGTYPSKRVVYTEHNTNPEGGVQRPDTTGQRPSRAPLGVHVLLQETATTSLASASRGCDAGPLPPAALVVPGHRPPSGRLAFGVPGRHPR